MKGTTDTASDLGSMAVEKISQSLRPLLADVFAHLPEDQELSLAHERPTFPGLSSAPGRTRRSALRHDRRYRRAHRKLGGTTLRSISDISKHRRLKDNNADSVGPREMLAELAADNRALTQFLRQTHEICDKHSDVATASLIENWIDQTERRSWFLGEITASD